MKNSNYTYRKIKKFFKQIIFCCLYIILPIFLYTYLMIYLYHKIKKIMYYSKKTVILTYVIVIILFSIVER